MVRGLWPRRSGWAVNLNTRGETPMSL